MSFINYIVTDKTLTFYVGGQPYMIDQNAAVFNQVVAELNKPEPDSDALIRLADTVRTVQGQIRKLSSTSSTSANYLPKGVINVTRDGVTYDGEVLDNPLADRLMDILSMGLRIGPWQRFAENLYMNPAEHAREELMDWLASSDLPITEDGCFLAYKKVTEDFKDIHTGTFDNSVGQVVQLVNREAVDPDRDRHCSRGLHFCSKSYLGSFGSGFGNKVVIVKINPADVVSIPSDYNFAKGRTWRYEVVDEIEVEGITDKVWEPISYDYNDDEFEDDYDYDEPEEDWDEEEVDEDEELDNQFQEIFDTLMTESIVTLRRAASQAGLPSALAWKKYDKNQLAGYIANQRTS